MRPILVGYTNISFYERLKYNPFRSTYLHFTIIVLTWYDFTLYSIVLPTSISARGFHTLSISFRYIIYVTTEIAHKGFVII